MQITYKLDLNTFEAWSGGFDTLNRIREEGKCQDLEYTLEKLYPYGISETQLNDILWFDREWVYETLGISDEDEKDNAAIKNINADIIRNIAAFLHDNEQYGDDWSDEIAELDKIIDILDSIKK